MPLMLILKTGKNQTIIDLAMKHYGNVEAIEEILNNNPHLLTDYTVMQDNDLPFQSNVVNLSLPFIENQVLYIDEESDLYLIRAVNELKDSDVTSFDEMGFIIPGTFQRDTSLDYEFLIL
jgi:hypothetical protein